MRKRSPLSWLWVALVVIFTLAPLGIMLMMSFSSSEFVRFPPPGFSLRWYRAYFASADWIDATLRSLWIGASVAGLSVLLGVPASLGIQRLGPVAGNLVLGLTTLPIILPPVVIAIAMYMAFSSLGLAGSVFGILFGHLTLGLPFVVLTTLAALNKMDPQYPMAARSLGSGKLRVFFTVTLPIIRPGILSGALFAFLTSFDELMIALFVGSSETRPLPRRMWEGVKSEFDPTISAASTFVVLTILALVAIVILSRRILRPGTRKT